MTYLMHMDSPVGPLHLAADGQAITGLWLEGQKYFGPSPGAEVQFSPMPAVFEQTKRWMDLFFSGKEPDFCPPLDPEGTDFQKTVWSVLRTIPYGETLTYGEVSKLVAAKLGRSSMSAQAVGGAVGRNPISIIVPCHRVIGADGSLTGYAGGLWRKEKLLRLERGEKL